MTTNEQQPTFCIHTQTHTPHFKYTDKLIKSLLELSNVCILKVPIYIVFDNQQMSDDYQNNYKYEYEQIYHLKLDEIMNTIQLNIRETFSELFINTINILWGAGEHRNYVAVKRTYSLLELEKRGYKHVWCMDSESLVLKKCNINNIIVHNMNKPLLTVGKNTTGIKYPQIITEIYKMDYKDFDGISVRMNDFWFIHTKHFLNMINMLFSMHKQPISYLINGSEQSLYEYYLYSLYLKDKTCVELIVIDGDLHHNRLFDSIIKNKGANINDFCDKMNALYFNKIYSYRGDYYRKCLKSQRGKHLIKKLNILVAVSNYQGI